MDAAKFPEFGPFATAFDTDGPTVPGYLKLLNLQHEDETQIVLGRIAAALAEGNSQQWVTALFTQFNWRPHLVGAMALLLDTRKQLDATPVWGAIDAGSWVTPQLIVAAIFSDPAFAAQAITRMDKGCPVYVPQMDPLTRHVATGPASVTGRSGKMAASILAVCSKLPFLAERETTWRANPQIQALLKEDLTWDHSEGITNKWLTTVTAYLLKRGIVLSLPPLRETPPC